MAKEDIEKLLSDENLPDISAPAAPIQKLDLKPSVEALEMAKRNSKDQKAREFNRADIASEKIQVQFTSAAGFARHYIENISLGGLFVRTDARPGIGAVIQMEFSVKLPNVGDKEFQLMGKVCRETDTGLGLQFTDFNEDSRAMLEMFIQTHLPKGMPLSNVIKRGTLSRLEQLREGKSNSEMERRWMLIKISAVALLLSLNFVMIRENFVSVPDFKPVAGERPSLSLKGEKIPIGTIRSLKKLNNGMVALRVEGGREILIKSGELRSIPMATPLRSSLNFVDSTPPKKVPRRTMNSRRRSRP